MTVAVTRLDFRRGTFARRRRGQRMRSRSAEDVGDCVGYGGSDRAAAARSCGMDRQTLRDWVYRYNAEGACGPVEPHGTRAHALPERRAEGGEIVRAGPDPEVDRVVRWRRIDLKHLIKERFGVVMHERTVGKQLAELGFRRLSVRPAHPQDPAAQAAFKKNFAQLVAAALPPEARGGNLVPG